MASLARLRTYIVGTCAVAVALGIPAGDVWADDTAAAAQALFDEAASLMGQKAYDRACPKLDEVVRLQPKKIGASMQRAQCYEGWGKLASAWSAYRAAGDLARAAGDARAAKADAKVQELAARLPQLTGTVAPEIRDTPGLSVERDGVAVGSAGWGTALPVDPGTHVVAAVAPGKKRWTRSVTLAAGDAPVTVTVPALEDEAPAPPPEKALPVLPAPPPAAAVAPPRALQNRPPETSPGEANAPVPAWAWGVGGAGLAAAGVALGFGIDAAIVNARQESKCPMGLSACPSTYTTLSADNAQKDRDRIVYGVVGGAGVAAIVAAVVGIATRPKRASSGGSIRVVWAPSVGPSLVGSTWQGVF
jgi:hypothetical protein